MYKNLFISGVVFLLCNGYTLHAQPAEISGVINDYAKVLEFDNCGGSAVVEEDLEDEEGIDLQAGDRVLIIQMTGALYYDGNDSRFGTVQSYSSCGLFEFATVGSVAEEGSKYRVTFDHPTLNVYQAQPGVVQLVKVPQYEDVTVTDELTAAEWNTTTETGGVLVFEATGIVTLDDADISVDGKGFNGGAPSENGDEEDIDLYGYVYPSADGESGESGERGGGIGVIPTQNAGRGPLVNGGGGGNGQNAGGGGGGNGGAGGAGGNQTYVSSNPIRKIGGLGGKMLDYSFLPLRRIFMGGGGGGGHQDDGTAGAGGRGGGIIIIRAARVDGNGQKISANGLQGATGGDDGAGGGGAGGTILLSVPNFQDDSDVPDVALEAKGGTGGYIGWDCYGTGGGGGGGVIGLSSQDQPASSAVTINIDKGIAGTLVCSGAPANNGAMDGSDGRKLLSILLPGDPLP